MTTRSALRYPVLILCTTGMTTCVPGSESEEPGEAREPAAATASGPASDSTTACFVAEQSVLARAANANTPGPADLRGWIRLKQFGVTDSAGATLMDSDGFALDAAWQRTGADSFVVAGFNDFVRVEIRLRETESGARGMLRASSDAALERDSSGKLREFRRTSRIHLSRAPCEGAPAAAGGAAIDVVAHGTPRPGIRFDPSTLQRRARIGTLIVDSIDARQALDSTWVGTAWFRGRVRLSGWTLRHPDPDLYRIVTCFEADSTSASQLPRWSGDERRAWFCFANRVEAARALGPPSEGMPATIVIDRFTIHRGLSDDVNSVRFVRLVRRGTRG
jgi:hypothetical protein